MEPTASMPFGTKDVRSMYRILEDIESALAELKRELRGIKSGLATLDNRLDQDRRERTGEMAKLAGG